MKISNALFQEIVTFLAPLPCCQDEKARQTLLILSGLRELLPHIECKGNPIEFVTLAVHQLAEYGDIAGEPALLLFLRGATQHVGADKKAVLQAFEARLKSVHIDEPLLLYRTDALPLRPMYRKDIHTSHAASPLKRRRGARLLGLTLLIAAMASAVGIVKFWPEISSVLNGSMLTIKTFISEIFINKSCWKKERAGETCTETNTGIEFVYVPGGSFWTSYDELPLHNVNVSGFWIGKYEVTQAQWQAIMKNNPSSFKGNDRPVEQVSWNAAQEFLQKLNAVVGDTGRSPLQFRLPSEAEWEYAARAGTQTAYSFGDDPNRLDEFAWYLNNSGSETHQVGQKPPNNFGLYDMHGNVWEWCQDESSGSPQTNPADASSGQYRVLRGGAWNTEPHFCRSANRTIYAPDNWHNSVGFRAVVSRTP